MESEGYSPPEASSGESMPEIAEDVEFELNPTQSTDTPEDVPESPEAHNTGELVESDLVPEPIEEDFPLRTVESEYGDARNKESLVEKEAGSEAKPSGVGDPAESAAEDQALVDEVQQPGEEQESELKQNIEDFKNLSNSVDDDISQRTSDVGKVLKNDDEPGISTHLHRHEDGLTISTKDQNTGTVERYNFNTGEGWNLNPDTQMSVEDRERRLTAEVPDYNPNPDAGTIEGFHSGIWGVPEHEDPEDKED